MFVIIIQEKDRCVGRILYDHNAENLQEAICWTNQNQLKYRKIEAKQVYLHYFINSLVLGIFVVGNCVIIFWEF